MVCAGDNYAVLGRIFIRGGRRIERHDDVRRGAQIDAVVHHQRRRLEAEAVSGDHAGSISPRRRKTRDVALIDLRQRRKARTANCIAIMRPFPGPVATLDDLLRRGLELVDLPKPHAECDETNRHDSDHYGAKPPQPRPAHPNPEHGRGDKTALQAPRVAAAFPDCPGQREGEKDCIDSHVAPVALESQPRGGSDGKTCRKRIKGAAEQRELRAADDQQQSDHREHGREDEPPTRLQGRCGTVVNRSLAKRRSRRKRGHGCPPAMLGFKRPTPIRTH